MMKHYEAEMLVRTQESEGFVVYMTTPAIPSCFVAFFSDPYSHFENFNFYYTSLFPFFAIYLWIMGLDCQVPHMVAILHETHKFVAS